MCFILICRHNLLYAMRYAPPALPLRTMTVDRKSGYCSEYGIVTGILNKLK